MRSVNADLCLRPGALLLCLAALIGGPARATKTEVVDYTVAAGDDCRQIVRRVWPAAAEKEGLDKLHALNPQLGPQPHNLVPGSVLKLPEPEPDAHLTFLKPAVNKRVLKSPDWRSALRGDGLFRLDEVNTLKGAGAEITFRDLSNVALDENALIVIYGDAPAQKKEQKSGALELVKGDAMVRLSDLRGERPLEVATPSAQVSLRSRGRAAIGVDDSKNSTVMVYAGAAEVAAQGKKVAVAAGQGTRVEQGKSPEPASALPAAPEWGDGVFSAAFALPSKPAAAQLVWKPVAGAVRYRAQVARDTLFIDRVADRWQASAGGAEAKAVAQVELSPGLYFARVQAADARGLTGPPSVSLKLLVLSVRAATGREVPGAAALTATGELRVVLDGAPSARIAVDGKEPQEVRLPALIGLLQPGKHEIKVGGGAPGQPAGLPCTVDAPVAKVAFGPPAADGALPVTVRLEDAAGMPLALPKDEGGAPALERLLKTGVLQLRDRVGSVIPAALEGEVIRATLPASAGKSVRVVWTGALIGEGRADK